MKLTKATQKQLDKAYDTLIQVCLYDKPLKDMEPYLADDVMNFGAGKKEITKTKVAFLKQIKGQKKLAAGLKMDFKINPILRKIINKGDGAIYTDDIVNTVWINEKENKLKFRLSFIFEYRNKKWILVHSHTSAPDSQRTDDEIWPVEELKKRTAVLEKSLDEKIAELQIKNRELEIESSLEKVRVIALSMKAPEDMPEVCKTIALQLQLLGLKEIRNVQTAIFYESRGIYMNYEYYARNDKTVITETVYTNHEVPKAFAAKMLKGNGEFYITHIKGKKVGEWLEYQKTTNVFIDHFLEKASSLNYYWYSLGPVALGISTYVPLSKKEIKLFKRFLNVFELAYTRYLDIEQAAAQAREAKIELGLERVRATTMAMQKSDELAETVHILFQQFKELGEKPDQATIGIINENECVIEYWVTMYGNQMNKVFKFSIDEPNVTNKIYKAWKQQKKSLVIDLSGKELYDFTTYRAGMGGAAYNEAEKRRMINVAFFSKGLINVQSTEARSVESIQLLERFAKVFEQTYTRFLDLQRAEGQARESQIEASLERVRSRSMGMQKSEELKEVIQVVYDQFVHLNIHIDHAGFVVDYKPKGDWHFWIADKQEIPSKITHPYFDSVWANQFDEAKEKGIDFFATHLDFEEKNKFYQNLLNLIPGLPEEVKKFYFSCPGLAGSTVLLDNVGLYIENFDGILFTDEENKTLMRFGKVFQQTYTRFLDLQKAEAQAREAQIEAALERVRSLTMAMQKSEDLNKAASDMFKQIQVLGMQPWGCGFNIFDKDEKAVTQYMSLADGGISPPFRTPLTEDPFFISIYDARQRGDELLVMESGGESLAETYHYMFNLPGSREIFGDLENSGFEMPKFQITHCAYFSQGYLVFITYEPVPEAHDIFKRFAKVFEQTYTRFLDLQKAEAQAREAEIELALERVRARTMAMQHSDELADASFLLDSQVRSLGIKTRGCAFNIYGENESTEWFSSEMGTIPVYKTPRENVFLTYYEEGQKGKQMYIESFTGDACAAHYDYLCTLPVMGEALKKIKESGGSFPDKQIDHVTYFKYGYLLFITLEPVPEAHDIFKRFAKVFEQTYTRFHDLQKAEAQAKEAHIEAALERVRSRTMGMQNSGELADLVSTVFTELNRLEFALTSCIIWINNPELLTAEMWVASTEMNKPPEPYYIKPFRHPYFKSVINAFKDKNKKWVYEMNSREKKIFQEAFFNEVGSFPTLIKRALEAPESVIYSASFFNFGALEIIGTEKVTDEKFEILHRLGKVFDMSYTRFNDLKQAEAQAREAKIEAALERVRSRTLAMQKSDELAETSAVVFRQLIDLGIEPNRLYIAIMKETTGIAEFWITDEDGSRISSGFTANLNVNRSFLKMFEGWKKQKKSIIIDMQGKELAEYFRHLSMDLKVPFQSGLSQQRRVQSIAYFSKGFIGIASPETQPDATINLLIRFASVFNLTYTRFNDLKLAEYQAEQARLDLVKLQTEKKRAEEALTELKATQSQLIQSEKMASLGELTAGIAHEIQNPLNFVNNFSEVSTELIDEMNTEIEQGNFEDARQIAEDLKQNLEKINHHGKRAGDIVKGMLQHSRSSSATKEPTDINKLADEYLRLAYHGLRAKDNTFSATMKTDYDETIGNINIIPQDIGRVILNLITNAFYVVTEKKKQQPEGYEPTVSVSTKKTDATVLISVKDNGNGIPPKVVDKIFQPFFTTKPTGQGTGLGLSLSYDIVKAQGGKIKVETKEGEGSEFNIQLPIA